MRNDLEDSPMISLPYPHLKENMENMNSNTGIESADNLEKRRHRDIQKYANMAETECTEYNETTGAIQSPIRPITEETT